MISLILLQLVNGEYVMKNWTFITKHGLVLLYISQNSHCTTREIANNIDAVERTVHRILGDLEE